MGMKKRRRQRPGPKEEASSTCDASGEEIVIPIDVSAGESQEVVEDCPVCCRPNVIHVEIENGEETRVWSVVAPARPAARRAMASFPAAAPRRAVFDRGQVHNARDAA